MAQSENPPDTNTSAFARLRPEKYKAMLREAFQPFELSIEEPAPSTPEVKLRKVQPGENWASTPFFAGVMYINDKS
jgi:hypothetical protein